MSKNRIQELEAKIRQADKAYWEDASPIMSDYEYDALARELAKLDPENELLKKVHASGNLDTSKLVKHPVPMLSLAKAYSLEEVMKWAKKYARSKNETFVMMPKYDGISGRWENGKLTSRGNGEWGQDYTDRIPLLARLPKASPEAVFGEILITDEQWNDAYTHIRTKSGKPFKNQRNAAAGIIGCDDVDFYAKQGKVLTFMNYDYFSIHVKFSQLEKEWEDNVKQIQAICECPMDGIVIKLADDDYWKSLGHNAHHPFGSIAFKFTNASAWSKLIGITWSMGKDQISAVGQVEPVDISGTTVQNVKLQLTPSKGKDGVPFCLDDGTLQIGDEVLIERAGDIIPYMANVRPGLKRKRVVLDKCPFCGAPVTHEGSMVKCTNDKCDEKIIRRLLFAAQTLGFKGIAGSYIRKLHELLGVSTPRQMLEVTEKQLRKHSEFGSKMAELYIAQQQKALKSNRKQVLTSMDMDSIGDFVSKKLLANFTWDKICSGTITAAELEAISGIGELTAKAAARELKQNAKEIQKYGAMFIETEEKPETKQTSTKGVVCFTGKSPLPRSQMQAKAREAGWGVADGITADVTLLVCGAEDSESNKAKKARQKGIKLMTGEDFLATECN